MHMQEEIGKTWQQPFPPLKHLDTPLCSVTVTAQLTS